MNGSFNNTLILRPISFKGNLIGSNSTAILKISRINPNKIFVSGSNLSQIKDAILITCDANKNFCAFDFFEKTQSEGFCLPQNFNAFTGVCALIATKNQKQIIPLLFGTQLSQIVTIAELIKFYANQKEKAPCDKADTTQAEIFCDKKEGENLPPATTSQKQSANQTNPAVERKEVFYDDEQLATENYYEIKENLNEHGIFEQDDQPLGDAQKQPEEKFAKKHPSQDERNSNFGKQEITNYYNSIKKDIDSLFEKYSPFVELSQIIPNSRWIKIPYLKKSFYVVGLIEELGEISYVVYGVPGVKNAKPKGFEKYTHFIPLSLLNQNQQGFWCIFQSAVTGENCN